MTTVTPVRSSARGCEAAVARVQEGQLPTVMRIGPYRLFFYSADGGEPAHVHIERDDRIAKCWLGPVRMAESGGFRPRDLREIEQIVQENEAALKDAWHDCFGN